MKRLVTAVLAVLLAGALVASFVVPHAMVSPGPLVDAHRHLDDACLQCHAPFRGVAATRCIACHAVATIGNAGRAATAAPRRMTASFHRELADNNCVACHSDHQLTNVPRFDHAMLRPTARASCETCHRTPSNALHNAMPTNCGDCHSEQRWRPARFDHSNVATTVPCASCHQPPADTLHATLGADSTCNTCHSTQAWRPATFEHSKYFALDRDHNASCVTCHPANNTRAPFSQYTCYGCHEHTTSNIVAEHAEEGLRDIQACVRCHRSANEHEAGGREGRGLDDDD